MVGVTNIIGGATLIALVVLFVVCSIIVDCCDNVDERSGTPWAFGGIFAGVILVLGIFLIDNEIYPTPKPMDVYQGHTTLEYKVVDGQPIDSTVIFTKEYLDLLK